MEYSKKSLVYFFEELVYATEYTYFYGATVAHLASNRRTRRKKCNAQHISLLVLYLAEGPILNKSIPEFASGS